MPIIAMGLVLLAASDGPPPYPDSLNCAALTRAWSELENEGRSDGARQAREDAEFWAFALMDSARRVGMNAQAAEGDYARAASAARGRFDRRDEGAARELLDCQLLIPTRNEDRD